MGDERNAGQTVAALRRRSVVVAALLAASAGRARAADASVTLDNFTFAPKVLTVTPGTRVTWTNHDDIPHTVVSRENPSGIKSPVLDTDESFSYTFTQAGTYGFFCSLHPHMQSTVIVR